MSRAALAALILAVILSGAAQTPTAPQCDTSLAAHVYRPDRLKVIKACIEVRGVIRSIRAEKDGDLHIQLQLDADQPKGADGALLNGATLLNMRNITAQHGYLVVEAICARTVTQTDAIGPCRGARVIDVPPVGSHVSVAGPYVLDRPHGWVECHPATSITVLVTQ